MGESLRERFGDRPEVHIRQDAVKLLSSETRLNILKLLDQRRMTVSELARALALNKSTVHEHLGKLVDGGLIRRDASEEREWVYYELTKTARYVLRPASARFVLLMGLVAFAGLFGVVLLHFALTAGQGLALASDDTLVPAGEANLWNVEVTRPGLLGLREPARGAELYLLDAEEAALFQLTKRLPVDARPLGAREALREEDPGRYSFRAALAPGVHYLAAVSDDQPAALAPVVAEPVRVEPRSPTVLVGVDPPQVEVAVHFRGEPVGAGLVQALDAQGRELAQVPVLNGRAVLQLPGPSDEVMFRFQPGAPGSAFAVAEGSLRAPRPHVAFEPAVVPLLVPADVRIVVDDPVLGPRANAAISVTRAGSASPLASGLTNANGSNALQVRLTEPGELIVKAGDLEVGRVQVKPGLRLWLEPGPIWEGERIRLRSLHLGAEPQPVAGVGVYLDGREVGLTDADGWLTLEFGLGGSYVLEGRREGYVPAVVPIEVLPLTGYVLPHLPHVHFAAAAFPGGLSLAGPSATLAEASRVVLGDILRVEGVVANPDSLPRFVPAELREDGAVVAERTVYVPAGGEAKVAFEYRPRTAGTHTVQVEDLPPVLVEAVAPAAHGATSETPRAVPGPGAAAPLLAVALAAVGLAAVHRARPRP